MVCGAVEIHKSAAVANKSTFCVDSQATITIGDDSYIGPFLVSPNFFNSFSVPNSTSQLPFLINSPSQFHLAKDEQHKSTVAELQKLLRAGGLDYEFPCFFARFPLLCFHEPRCGKRSPLRSTTVSRPTRKPPWECSTAKQAWKKAKTRCCVRWTRAIRTSAVSRSLMETLGVKAELMDS